jgi:hypothetical protein
MVVSLYTRAIFGYGTGLVIICLDDAVALDILAVRTHNRGQRDTGRKQPWDPWRV